MNRCRIICTLGTILSIFMTLSARAALIGVLPATPGGTDWQAVYDADINVTWVSDASLGATMNFGVSGINSIGTMTWDTANEWIDAMNAASYLGFNDWRLPFTLQPDASCETQANYGSGFPLQGQGNGCTGSEMGHLFNDEGISADEPGLFSNIISTLYWSSTELAPDTSRAWNFSFFGNGFQGANEKIYPVAAWAVRPGEVLAAPAPAAVWLFGSGLLGLVGISRRKKAS
jgi:hypothetical protein